MTRLIDADALIEKYGDWYVKNTEDTTQWGFVGSLREFLKEQPEVDAIPADLIELCRENEHGAILASFDNMKKAVEHVVWYCVLSQLMMTWRKCQKIDEQRRSNDKTD